MSFSLGYSPILLLLSLLIAGGLTFWMYQTAAHTVTGWQRRGMMGLRFFALAILLFLLMEPIWQRITEHSQPPVLAVLLDNSLSLSDQSADDEDDPRHFPDQVRSIVDALPAIDGEFRFFSFGSEVNSLGSDASSASGALSFDEERTDISAGLQGVRDRLSTDNLQGVLVVSDGLYNTGRNPLNVAERYPHAIHTVVVGDTTEQRDVLVQRASTNEIAYVDVEQPVEATIRATGARAETVTVSLRDGDAILDEESITLPEGNGERTVSLSFTPSEEGLKQLDVVVSGIEAQITDRNNRRSVGTQVLERRRQVLLVSGGPTPTMGAVRRVLEADEDVEVQTFTQRTATSFYEGDLPETLDEKSLVILLGFPSSATSPELVDRLQQAVEDGLPLLYIHSRHGALDQVATTLGDWLPVSLDTASGSQEARVEVTAAGRGHSVLEGLSDEIAAMDRLPPLRAAGGTWEETPDARTLLELAGENQPLLTVRSRAGHRSATWLGSNLWDWFTLPEELAELDALAPTLTSNLVEWLATDEDDRLVRVSPTELEFTGSESVTFEGEVYNESLNPVSDATVRLEIEDQAGDTFPYTMEALGNGQYRLDAGTLPEGRYSYRATATRDETEFGTDAGNFQVEQSVLEFLQTRADAPFMRQLANRSGGTFFIPEDVERLADILDEDSGFSAKEQTLRTETPLWHLPWLMLLAVLLLAAEWAWRKRAGLV